MKRAWEWLLGLATLAVVAGPPLFMVAATVVDRAQGGLPRVTAFPLALAASDPTVWEAAHNSLILAGSAACGSMILGVALARAAVSRRFRGARGLAALARASGLAPPAFSALGLLGLSALLPRSIAPEGPWPALLWAEMAWGVPRVAIAAASAIRRIDPSWDDAARLAGASPRTRWKTIAWPLVRPVAARASADVFLWTLFEPSATVILGARRTLAFQAAQAAIWGEDLARAASLGAIAWMLGLSGRGLIRAWGGATFALADPEPARPRPRASWPRTIGSATLLLAIAAFGLIPAAGLIVAACGWGGGGRAPSPSAFRWLISSAEVNQGVTNGLILGLATALVVWIAIGNVRRHARWRRLALSARLVPPLVFGIGLVALPGLLRGFGLLVSRQAAVSLAIERLARGLDPYASPWPGLIVAVAAVRLPDVALAIRSARDDASEGEIEVARTLGASPWTAWRTIRSRHAAGTTVRWLGWTIVQGTMIASPALVLTPTTSARPIVPALSAMLAGPEGLKHAAAFAVAAMALPLLARLLLGPPPGVAREMTSR